MKGTQSALLTFRCGIIGRRVQQGASTALLRAHGVISTHPGPKSTLFQPTRFQQFNHQSACRQRDTARMDSSMAYNKFTCFKVEVESGIARVTLDYAPLNLLDEVMSSEFSIVAQQLEHDNDVRAVILKSALPEFFIAHSGLARVASGGKQISAARSFRLTQVIGETLRSMPKVTIAQVEGRCRGGGNEIAMACDMCFAALGSAIFGQPEVAFGLVPGGGSTQRLPRLMGRARALEVLLTGQDFSATDAERMGFINKAVPAGELGAYVDQVATNIARLPKHAVRLIKQSVDRGFYDSISEGLLVEAQNADECMTSEVTRERVSQAMALGVETKEVELDIPSLIDRMK